MKLRLLVLLVGVLSGVEVLAARPARVEVEEAPVYSQLTPDAPILAHLPRGSRVIVSNVPTQGFYKVRLSDGATGWVATKALVIFDRPSEDQIEEWRRKKNEAQKQAEQKTREVEERAEEERWREDQERKRYGMINLSSVDQDPNRSRKGPRHFLMSLFVGGSSVSLSNVKTLTQLSVPDTGFHVGGELHYRIRRNWIPLIFRVEHIGTSNVIKDSSTNKVYDMSSSATPMLVGTRYDLIDTQGLSFDVAAFLGISYNQTFNSTALNESEPNKTELAGTALAVMLKGDLNYAFADFWFFFLEGGWRMLDATGAEYSTPGSNNGTTIFKDTGALKKVPLDLSGFFMSLGVSYNF